VRCVSAPGQKSFRDNIQPSLCASLRSAAAADRPRFGGSYLYDGATLTRFSTDLDERTSPDLIDRIMTSIDVFAGDAPLYDDITLMVVRRS